MTQRRRIIAFSVVCTAAVAIIVGYVLAAALGGGDGAAPAAAGTTGNAAAAPPIATGDLLALDRNRAHPKAWGRLVVVGDGGARRVGTLSCERVAFAGGRGICLAQTRTFPAPAFEARFFDARQRVTHEIGLKGTPSRARVSPGGRYAASTTFVSGDAYTTPGAFSTRTTIYDARGGTALAELENFSVTRDGKPFHQPDFNFWGVTFIGDSGAFYATLATGSHHYLVRGDVARERVEVVRDGVECPSLSPDGTKLGFKARVGDPFQWRFHVLDLKTGQETALTETQSVDDQIAWVDDEHVAYGVGEEVMTVAADGTGAPRPLLASATNPGRVH